MEEARRDAGLSDDVALLHKVSDAVAARDLASVAERMHPEVVWEHNIGRGTPEEGVYRGRDDVVSLLARILEPWEQLRAEIDEVRDLGDGHYEVTGRLRAKHSTSATEVLSPYVQHFEVENGLLVKGRMSTGEISFS